MDSLHTYKADLHIHTVLSPCGSLEMSPANIVKRAIEKDLDILGIADHNAMQNAMVTKKLAEKSGIFVLTGMEVTTVEEVHCLAFFETEKVLKIFQEFVDAHILKTPNNPEKFGYQLIVDELENILGQVEWMLINATNLSIDEIEKKVHQLEGIFIPAHIDRQAFSLTSQLGFVPPDLNADAYEISKYGKADDLIRRFPCLEKKVILAGSDAHFINDVGAPFSEFTLKKLHFSEIKKALSGMEGRMVKPVFDKG
ncbi:MAG: PHP domain-containing protein [Bacteroidales bacterium]|nr:PHP domain-containing protein [Bacteroidales bacterium]